MVRDCSVCVVGFCWCGVLVSSRTVLTFLVAANMVLVAVLHTSPSSWVRNVGTLMADTLMDVIYLLITLQFRSIDDMSGATAVVVLLLKRTATVSGL